MNSFPLTIFWLKIFALIALEVGIVTLLLAAFQRACRTAVWRRTLCQAALIAGLVIASSELSGVGRSAVAQLFARTTDHSSAGIDKSEESARPDKSLAALHANERLTPEIVEAVALPSDGLNTISPVEFPDPVGTRSTASVISEDTLERSPANLSKAKDIWALTDTTAIFGFGAILAIGTAFFTGRAFLGRFLLIFLGSRRKAASAPTLYGRVDAIACSLKISRRVRIVESRRLVSPIAFGLLRPTIGLPLNFWQRFSGVKQEAMLTHELAHLAAHDPFWYMMADLAVAAFWWHPAVWWMRRQLQFSSELAADEASLMSIDGPRVLAECLVEMGAQLAKPVSGQLRVAGFRSDLGCRVQRLMQLEGAKWSPISPFRTILTRSIGPIALAGAVILCTAWAVPRQLTQGESIKAMKQNWQRALATVATIAAIQAPTIVVAQQTPPNTPPGPAPATQPYQPAVGGPIPANPNPGPGRNEFPARYGTSGGGGAMPYFPGGQPGYQPHGGKLEGKLREIVLDEVKFDGLPLSEVLNFLGDESRKRDPEKKGINFLINPNPPEFAAPAVGTVDPTTGLPVATTVELVDVNSISVRFNMPLRHVTMADVLDAIVKVADHPVRYSVEDYAVIFSLRPDVNGSVSMAGRVPAPAPLAVRTFHVDTNTFYGGLESAFGIKIDTKGKEESKKMQASFKELLAQLNVSMDGNKAIFYNELTGTVMVRVAMEDLDVVQAAIETLGGQAIGAYAMIGYPGPVSIPARRR